MVATQAAPPASQTQGQGLLAGAAGGQANQQRAPFWNVGMQGGAPPMLAAGLPANFYPQMAAFAAAQENATAMIAVSKLGPSKTNPNTNSTLVLRSSVRKFNASGAPLSVAQWTRQTVEENLEWLVKLTKRHSEGHKAILLAYGDGCETLVLLDDQINKLPSDFNKLKKVCIGCSMTNADSTLNEGQLAKQGVLQPVDSLWEHLRFETLGAPEKKVEKCLFIHTHISIYTGSMEGRRRVLQVKTGTGLSYQPNPLFEQQVLSAWAGQTVGATPAAGVVAPADQEEPENETVITFNPKELLLLEKAFDNRLTNRDLKAHSNKFTEEDRIAAQFVIKRAHAEFVMRGPPRKRRKKDETTPETKVEEKKEVTPEAPKEDKKSEKKAEKKPVKKEAKKDEEKSKPETPKTASKAKAKTPAKTPKSSRKAKEADEDDDEPISKMVKKEKSPAKKGRRQSSGSTKDKEKTPKTVKKEAKVAKPQESAKKRTRKSKK